MNCTRLTAVAAGLLLATVSFAGCGSSKEGDAKAGKQANSPAAENNNQDAGKAQSKQPVDIVATASAAGSFKTLLAAAQAAGLAETLQADGPFTVFAPSDDAFAKLPAGTVESLLKPENKDQLAAILTYHVVPGKVMSSQAVKLDSAKTVNGQSLALQASEDGLSVDGAKVVTADIECSNGVIHVIDAVVLPKAPADATSETQPEAAAKSIVETAVGAGTFQTLVAAVTEAGLVETLQGDGPFTVFAPNDEAFAKLPEGTVANLLKPENRDQLVAILTYHVVPAKVMSGEAVKLSEAATVNGQMLPLASSEEGLTVGGATVIAADIDCSNGVIHVVDSVILPPADEDSSAAAEASDSPQKDIVATAIGAGTFQTLVAAVQKAGLVETLQGDGPFTVFAPSDEAFAKLPEGTIEKLLKPENKDMLVSVLTYHVVPAKVMSADALKLDSAATVNGQQLSLAASDAGLSVDGAKVVAADIECSNGVIHVIDSVVLPK